MSEFTVAAGLARGLIEFSAAMGAERAELVRRSGIDPGALDDRDRRIPLDQYVALTRAATDLSGDPALALRFGGAVDLSQFSVLGLLFHACETIFDGIEQVNRYGPLVVEVETGGEDRVQFRRMHGALWLVDVRRNPNDFPELTEATFARFIGMTRHFGPLVTAVEVTHPAPRHREDYDRIFGAPTTFASRWNAMRLDERWLRNPARQEPSCIFGILTEHADALLDRLEDSRSVQGRVESVLMPILHTGEVGIERVAKAMGCSRATLYRQLRAEGITFEQVLDALRHRLARHYVGMKRMTVKEIAYLVGFSDPASFSRAFKRWTGRSPGNRR